MVADVQLQPGLVFDGYTLVRPLGQGGFGTVWLVISNGTRTYHALKWISGGALEHEWSAVRLFREVSQRLRSPHLIAIEHVNRTENALYYTMPLADGAPGRDPTKPNWKPFTLADLIGQKKSGGTWLSSPEILALFLPVAQVALSLNREGLVHRDIKPANILFFGGQPCLSDVGLLGNDRLTLSVKGTPGHVPPSWYEGEPDMWGLATTLYVLLTGNPPDTMGRANFRWPRGNKETLSESEQTQWQRLHNIILRATAEGANERYIGLETFVKAVSQDLAESPPPIPPPAPPPLPPDLPAASIPKPKVPPKNSILQAILWGTLVGIFLTVLFVINFKPTDNVSPVTSQEEAPAVVAATPLPIPSPTATQSSEEIAQLQSRVETLIGERDAEQKTAKEREAWEAAATPELIQARKDAELVQTRRESEEAYLRNMLSPVPSPQSQEDSWSKEPSQHSENTNP